MNKKFFVLLMCVFLLTSCSNIKESLQEPVDKNDNTIIKFEVKKGDNWTQVAKRLSENKLISNETVFKSYINENNLSSRLQPGVFNLKRSMSLSKIVENMTASKELKDVVKVTIPEGKEIKHIVKLLKKKGVINSGEKFISILKNEKFDYEFLNGVDRKTNLEGYLFPDTYQFYKGTDEKEVIKKMLDRFDNVYSSKYRKRAKELNLSDNEVITLASIIQREARATKEFSKVASVFHNRLKMNKQLEACSTIQYVLKERKDVLTYDDLKINSPYNTYKNVGLPPAPISSVGEIAIKAALYPDKTDYLFFVVKNKGDGTHYFAKTFAEHQKNIEKSNKNLKESAQ